MSKSVSYKFALIFGALLISHRYLGLSLEGEVPYIQITFDDPKSAVWALLVLMIFFSTYYIYHWKKDDAEPSKFDLVSILFVSMSAIAPYFYDELQIQGIGWKDILWAVAACVAGTPIGIALHFIITALFSIRSKREMTEMGLHRLPPSSTAVLYAAGVLTLISIILAFVFYLTSSRMPSSTFSQISIFFYLLPAVILNISVIRDILLCLGPGSVRRKALKRLRVIKKASDLHEMHLQHIGAVEPRSYKAGSLLEAIQTESVEDVEKLLKRGLSPDEQDPRGWSPLMMAAAEGRSSIVALLVIYGADPNKLNYLGRSALMYASRYGYLHVVEQLIAARADLNSEPYLNSLSALSIAAAYGHADVVRMLVNHGANVLYSDSEGRMAIDHAMINQHAEVARILRAAMRQEEDHSSTNINAVIKGSWLD